MARFVLVLTVNLARLEDVEDAALWIEQDEHSPGKLGAALVMPVIRILRSVCKAILLTLAESVIANFVFWSV